MSDQPMWDSVEFSFWQLVRYAILLLALAIVGAVLWVLPYLWPKVRYVAAVTAVSCGTVIVVYAVWYRVMMRCFEIGFHRHNHCQYGRDSQIKGKLYAPVSSHMIGAIVEVLGGYVVLALMFGTCFARIGCSTAGTSWSNNLYFSFVTFSTIGYGDLQPLGFGKVLASIQSIAFLLYNAVAIGGVIALIAKITLDPRFGFRIVSIGEEIARSRQAELHTPGSTDEEVQPRRRQAQSEDKPPEGTR